MIEEKLLLNISFRDCIFAKKILLNLVVTTLSFKLLDNNQATDSYRKIQLLRKEQLVGSVPLIVKLSVGCMGKLDSQEWIKQDPFPP